MRNKEIMYTVYNIQSIYTCTDVYNQEVSTGGAATFHLVSLYSDKQEGENFSNYSTISKHAHTQDERRRII
jgi:hypothetical protein